MNTYRYATIATALLTSVSVHAQQAVQWKVSEGGNGHWYGHASVAISDATFWQTQAAAAALGGHLPTISSVAENAFVRGTIGGALGLYHSPGGQWTNVTGEPVTYFNWQAGQPSSLDQFVFAAYCCHPDDFWADYTDAELGNPNDPVTGFSIEFSADCNNDSIVDYGQILAGQLADINGNGVPDICEGPTCHDADLFRNGVVNGADLGILLSEWGPAPSGTVSDINRDGQVNGADLGYLLNSWGSCGS